MRVTSLTAAAVRLFLPAAFAVLPAVLHAQSVSATRTDQPIVLDGRDDDPVWRIAPATGGFRESRPSEDSEPKQRTEFRVAYDPQNLYVFVRAYDTSPDSIVQLLSRRDDQTASDQLIVMIDSYRDRRTGYEFVVNPAGVKADYAIYNDGNEDGAWDAVWDAATQVDSLGWTAEYRIPFSQLRFTPSESVTFGFMVWRELQRHTAQLTWPLWRPSRSGFVSQFGELNGLTGLARPARAEVAPYVLTQNEPLASAGGGFERHQKVTVGGDLRYAVASNLTLTATVNPDFGQVEADPAVLNLSAFETFFSERRPFFVAGAGLFDFRVNCFVVVDCSTGEQLFYSRRIGRSPRLSGIYGDESSPTATRILGAAKLTGRLSNGLSIGFLDAVTDRADGLGETTLEPTTNYGVFRANQDYAGGNGSVGLIVTGVNRWLDPSTEAYMHASAYTGGLDARRRFGQYEVSGALMGSRVGGTAEAIGRTQREPVHYFQRPDDDLELDPDATSLAGYSGELRFAKVGGQRTVFETGYGRRSPGFDINDIGFLRRANEQTFTNWLALRFNEPNAVFQRLNWNFNWWQYWTLEGLPTDRAFNTNVHTQFTNRWWLHLGGTIGVGRVYCDRNCTRGGPALKVEPGFSPWGGIEGDNRKSIIPSFWVNYSRNDGGRSTYYNLNPSVRLNVSSRFSTTLSANYSRNKDDSQWFGNFTDGGGTEHFTFARLDQRTLGVTWRLNYTFTPNASLQLYANPFISKGTYSDVREIADPRADAYEARFQPYADAEVADDPGGFNVKEFRSNVVFRWEYRPGSTLFLVWSQGREHFSPVQGTRSFWGDFDELFGQRANDVFLVKVSYWLSR
ncbi:MAG TPA: DUF5916 domain-containing protein [Gemmatimonadales bacterium]